MLATFTPDYTGRDLGGRWQSLQARSNSVGNNLVVDSPIVPSGKHWLINNLSFQVNSPNGAFDLRKTECGLYACPPGTPADPLNIASRPIRLDSPLKALNESNAGGTSFGTCLSSVNPFILPAGWFLRGIVPLSLVAFVQTVFGNGFASATTGLTFPGNNVAGNSIVAFIAAFNTGGGGAPNVFDTQGNPYLSVGPLQIGVNSGNFTQCFIAKNIKPGPNTFKDSNGGFGTLRNVIVAEYVADAVNPLLSENSIFQAGTAPIPVALNVRPGNLVVLCPVVPGVLTVPSGFTQRANLGAITSYMYDKIVTSDSSPFSISTTDVGGGSLWGMVLGNQAFGILNGLFIQRDNC
jgi:hypothetical protein